MKPFLVALAALCSAASAGAQSSVTLFGVVDVAYAVGRTSASHVRILRESGLSASRIGFRGVEDLGGGMSASFWLEAGIDPSDGQGQPTNSNNQVSGTAPGVAGRQGFTFNRRSFVSVAGKWGEVRIGREYTPSFWNLTVFDPFATTGVATSQLLIDSIGIVGSTFARASNSITYSSPGCIVQVGCSGLYGQVMVMMGENASNAPGGSSRDGNGLSLRVGYANGPFNVAAGHGNVKYATTATTGDTTQSNLGVSWKFGTVLASAAISRDRRDSSARVEGHGYLVGVLAPVGAGEVRASFASYRKESAGLSMRTSKGSLGYAHYLSKRTTVYGTVSRLGNSGGAAQALNGATGVVNGGSTGYDLGIRHSF